MKCYIILIYFMHIILGRRYSFGHTGYWRLKRSIRQIDGISSKRCLVRVCDQCWRRRRYAEGQGTYQNIISS